MKKTRPLAANLQPDDVVRGCTVATVVGDSSSEVYVSAYSVDGRRVEMKFRPGARVTAYRREPLARTGRPSRLPYRLAVGTACAVTVTALGVTLAPTPQAPAYPLLSDVVTAPVVTPSPVSPQPYRPEPRPAPHTTREGVRETLTPSPSATIARPSTTPTRKHPIATPPADIRISFYRNCSGNPQPCIDAGSLTMYAGRILAGHNFDGYQWLSRVPVGRTVRVISGPLAGTYTVYGHLTIGRQGGSIPAFPGSPALVLQTCEGSGTGFSLLHRA
ncbi:hypothetical protein [Streptomyces sp. NPDC056291]|uniref:hypothetical protein n=1 Tax=Streptomyces sp. NPDC056291 TaxID=3345772 RepID=UPI0035DF0137